MRREAFLKPGCEVGYLQAENARRLEKERRLTAEDEPDPLKRKDNASFGTAYMLWSAVMDLIHPARNLLGKSSEENGWLEIVERDGEKLLRVSGRRYICPTISNVPTLVINAVHQPELVREVMPRAEDKGTIRISAPHMTVRQYLHRSYSLNHLEPYRKPKDGKKRTLEKEAKEIVRSANAAKHRRETVAVILRRLRELGGGKCLIITNKTVAETVEFKNLAEGVYVIWYGDVAGLNRYSDVRLIVPVGRWPVTPEDVETSAATLTGRPVQRLKGEGKNSTWYDRKTGFIHKRDGGRVIDWPVEVDCHPDPTAEELRYCSFVGELVQAIGRARGSSRGPDDPVEVMALTNVPLPLIVDEFISDAEMQATWMDLMLADGGIAFENAAAAWAYYGTAIWPSEGAAKSALNREQRVANPYMKSPIGKCYSVVFQKAGEHHKPQYAFVDPRMIPEDRLQAAMEAKLGPLARCEVLKSDEAPAAKPVRETPAPSSARVGRIFRVEIADGIVIRQEPLEPRVICHAVSPADRSPQPKRRSRNPATTPELPDGFWPSIRQHQGATGWSQGKLAHYCGVSQGQLCNCAEGRKTPSEGVVEKLKTFLAEIPPVQSGLF